MTGHWIYPSYTVLANVYLCPPTTFMNKCIIMDYEMTFERLKTSIYVLLLQISKYIFTFSTYLISLDS